MVVWLLISSYFINFFTAEILGEVAKSGTMVLENFVTSKCSMSYKISFLKKIRSIIGDVCE